MVLQADLAVDLAEKSLRRAIINDGNSKGQFTQAATDHVRALTDVIRAWTLDTCDADLRAGLENANASADVVSAALARAQARRILRNHRNALDRMAELVRSSVTKAPPFVTRVVAKDDEAIAYQFTWMDIDPDFQKKIEFYLGLIQESLDASQRYSESLTEANAALPEAVLATAQATRDVIGVIEDVAFREALVEVGALAVEVLLDVRQLGPWAFMYHATKEAANLWRFPGPPAALPESFYTNGGPIDPDRNYDEILDKFGENLLTEGPKALVSRMIKQVFLEFTPAGNYFARTVSYPVVEFGVLKVTTAVTYAEARQQLGGAFGGRLSARAAAIIGIKILAKSVLGAVAAENAERHVENSAAYQEYLEARAEAQFVYRSQLMWSQLKQISREVLRQASDELLDSVANIDQNGWQRMPDIANKTAPWQPTDELDLVVTFSRAVQDVKVLVGAPGEPQTAVTGQIGQPVAQGHSF